MNEVLLLLYQGAFNSDMVSKLKPVKYFGICAPGLERSTVTFTGVPVGATAAFAAGVLCCPEGANRSGFVQDIRHRNIPATNIGFFISMPDFDKYQTIIPLFEKEVPHIQGSFQKLNISELC